MEPVTRVGVTVTFLRMDRAPAEPAPKLPPEAEVRLIRDCSVAQYRALYNAVGERHVWWLRRTMTDQQLWAVLRDPRVGVHALRLADQLAGFYDIDSTSWPLVNLSYFGLMPHAVGRGLGYAFLRHAVDAVWRRGARAMTVNTCTADHPNALPTYRRAGFRVVREIAEVWNVPDRLGLVIPEALRL